MDLKRVQKCSVWVALLKISFVIVEIRVDIVQVIPSKSLSEKAIIAMDQVRLHPGSGPTCFLSCDALLPKSCWQCQQTFPFECKGSFKEIHSRLVSFYWFHCWLCRKLDQDACHLSCSQACLPVVLRDIYLEFFASHCDPWFCGDNDFHYT